MKPKNFLAQCQLLALLQASGDSSPDAPGQLAEAFDRFAQQLAHAARTSKSSPDLLRLYAFLRVSFKHLRVGRNLPSEEEFYVEAALSYLENERNLLLLRIRFPSAEDPKKECQDEPIQWSATYSQTDLMELLSALHAAGAIRRADGRAVELKTLIRAFERFLDVSIRNPDRCRYATLNRSLHLTKFLDTLRAALIERSQR